jgi:hypothetical protein
MQILQKRTNTRKDDLVGEIDSRSFTAANITPFAANCVNSANVFIVWKQRNGRQYKARDADHGYPGVDGGWDRPYCYALLERRLRT